MTAEARIVLTLVVFALTIALMLARPRGWHEAWWTVGGGTMMLLLRLETPRQAWQITRTGQDALLFLLALLVFSALLERSGFFEWAAIQAARQAHGDGQRLYRNVFLLGAFITATLSLDTTAVILTPIVLAFVARLKLPARPYIFACAFVANIASLPLPVSNLTNLLFTGAFGLPFGGFALRMALPQGIALLSNYILFRRLFRGDLRDSFSLDALPEPPSVVPHPGFFRASISILGAVLIGYFFAPFLHIQPYVVGFVGCGILAVWGVRAGRVDAGLMREISWPVFPFVIGLFVLMGGVENLGLAGHMATWLARWNPSPLAGMAVTAGASGLASNIVNNIPAALLARSVLQQSHAGLPLVYSALLGTNIGPNLTLTGSLATLLVLTAARRKGEGVHAGDFFKVGLLVVPLTFLAAIGALWLTFFIWPAGNTIAH